MGAGPGPPRGAVGGRAARGEISDGLWRPEVWTSPRFRVDDPVEKRDAAIAEWIKVLQGGR